MKITVTAPTGNIGRVLTNQLLESSAELTLLARSPEKVAAFAERGAGVVQGSLEDVSAVRRAVDGADALFWLTPPDYTAENFRAYCNSLGDVAAQVAGENPELRVVNLSSTGAHLAEGVGPIKGLHDIEQKLNAASQR
ncbi:MAG: NAD(P)H-binding protein, partial [bacterium]|nr:NAD(P)H-binding protein [bacterium]